MQSMHQRADTLLIIQLNDLDPNDIPQNMKAYMGQKNWIKFDESNFLFWANLFEQLHKPNQDLQQSDLEIATSSLGITNPQVMEENTM